MAKGKQQHQTQSDNDNKHEQALQAVLLADSFTRTFRPLSLDQPRVLSPLNNVILLDYGIEFLVGSGVKEIFVVCLADEVEQHVEQNHWAAKTTTIDITVVKDSSITNAGDALRELDKRNLVQSDPFILMFGDTVSNVDIQPALEAHKARHKKDSSAMMTLLFKSVGPSTATTHSLLKPGQEDLIVGLDPSHENRLLLYDDHPSGKKVRIPCSIFASHPEVQLHSDMLDCGIDICSPDVLARFSDEFDYRDIRKEFVTNSVAEEEEGLQNKIFAHLLPSHEYAARVHDFASYAAISRDLLRRWCYPVVPDNLPSGYETKYRYSVMRHAMYREQSERANIGRTSTLIGPGMVGRSCEIGHHCRFRGTVIGNYCKIASDVVVEDSFLWNNVTIEEGARISQAILSNDCIIRAGAVVPRGCVVGQGCIIDKGVKLKEFTRITQQTDKDNNDDGDFDDFDDDEPDDTNDGDENGDNPVQQQTDRAVVGPDGLGRAWLPLADDDDDSDDENGDMSPLEIMKSQSIGYNFSEHYKMRYEMQRNNEEDDGFSEDEDAGDDEDDGFVDFDTGGISFEMNPISSTNGTTIITGRQKGIDVIKELKTICLEHEETAPVENLAIELNSFKFSQNATYSDCTRATLLAILDKLNITAEMSSGKLVAGLNKKLEHWAPLLRKMSIGIDEEKSIIVGLEQAATAGGPMGENIGKPPGFRFLLQTLHNKDVVSEEAILSWAEERRKTVAEDSGSPTIQLFQQQPTQDFLEWLEDEDDEDSEDEDSDAGSDED